MRYPNAIKKSINPKVISHKNRGMSLEEALNKTNLYYLEKEMAVIYKKPTPIKVLETKYKEGNKQFITKAIYEKKSTTDYNGVYKGRYIDFEAKETENKIYFPLSNIKKHQINHIKNVINQKGIVFIIIKFTKLDKTFLLDGKVLLSLLDKNIKNVNINFLEGMNCLIKEKYNPRLDYLSVVDNLYFKEELWLK